MCTHWDALLDTDSGATHASMFLEAMAVHALLLKNMIVNFGTREEVMIRFLD